jgi:DNA-binding XRE family transcriptional regulator
MKNKALIEARHKAGFTQKQVADRVGIAEVSYQRLEYGQKPSLRTAICIADLLNILDLRTLWGGNLTA